jgi:hypothetical protein
VKNDPISTESSQTDAFKGTQMGIFLVGEEHFHIFV